MRTRSYLLLLFTIILLPGFLAAGFALQKVREREREVALRALRESVRATALLVDGQIQRSVGALGALGSSAYLQTGDFESFYRQAKLSDHPPDVWTLLLDETGLQRLNTAVPYGTPPPQPAASDRVRRVLETQRLLVSDVIVGPATGKLLTTIYLPAQPSAAGRFVVAQAFSVEQWKRTALQPQGHDDWIVGVIDRAGRFISRSHDTAAQLGRPARPELVAAAAAATDGLIRHRTLEGIEVYDAFTRSSLTGWTIAIAAPVASIESSATQAIAWLGFGIALALATALAAASMLGRTIVGAIDGAAASARRLGEGHRVETRSTVLAEAKELNDALVEAGRVLQTERASRERAQEEREQLLEKERLAREAAQLENAAKDQFLALLGHELRNPLAAIAGATGVLLRLDQSDAASRARYLAMVGRQTGHLKRIVDDLLEASRMLSGKLVLELQPLDLADCVRHCVEAMQASERAAAHTVVLRARSVWVQGDRTRLEQVVSNLLTNALKFSAPGTEIRVSVWAAGELALLEVRDSGAGIAPDLIERIFEPFVQGPPTAGRLNSGLGLGLALARQIVDLHGGGVRAQSAGAGQGAVFTVSLPTIPAPAVSTDESGTSAVSSRSWVLVVEDMDDARETTARLLRSFGYGVTEAADGAAAMRSVAERRPDAILLDIGLPGHSGLQIASELKRDPALRDIPLIALSGYGMERDRQAAEDVGFASYLVKPSSPEAIACAIEDSLKLARAKAG